ncbi:hypothetical protein FHS57_000493 [Runella defluvii]|uniref:Uncharacterized protein n=1 Tax=Runella defluvii TaxID=370973 RepID=A0A7W5ZG04_9BACT|nr:hypothetical protein [Runella defluvii]MBB3836511.1 hypothetical protein [Runella defluvii]
MLIVIRSKSTNYTKANTLILLSYLKAHSALTFSKTPPYGYSAGWRFFSTKLSTYNFAMAFDFESLLGFADAVLAQDVWQFLSFLAQASVFSQAVLQHFDLSQQLGLD